MGVAGAGKTTVGRLLAESLHFRFVDADDFHPPANIEKMTRGIPLDEPDRSPWIKALAAAIEQWLRADEPVVLACSALRARHRAELAIDPERVAILYLRISPELARARVGARAGHFLKDNLIQSQFEALEEPSNAIELEAALPPEELVRQIRDSIGR